MTSSGWGELPRDPEIVKLLRQVKLVVFDFDGVLTDNRVIVGQDGSEYVVCSRADGIGLDLIRRLGIDSLVLSTEQNPVVKARADKLGVECVHGCDEKWQTLRSILDERGLSRNAVGYMGNDVNDLECLENVAFPIVVADAHPVVRRVAKLVTIRPGGRGAVRELCELIVQARCGGDSDSPMTVAK